MSHRAKVLMKEFVTHNVTRFIIERPQGYSFVPGHYALLSIDKDGLREDMHPFTFTSLPGDEVLEFTIKIYPEHHGLTEKLDGLESGDILLLTDHRGSIEYGGPGMFIAGGAGITPFIAILRDLRDRGKLEGNAVFFSNRTHADIMLERELQNMLKDDCIFSLTDERREGYLNHRIDADFLKQRITDFSQRFYVCGPPKMVEDITSALKELGAEPDAIVFD